MVRAHERRHLLGIQQSARRIPRTSRDARDRSSRTELSSYDVSLGITDELGPGAYVQAEAELIGHRSGRCEQAGLLAEHRRDPPLESIDGRVLGVDVVTDLGGSDSGAHAGTRSGHGVAAQIYEEAHERRA